MKDEEMFMMVQTPLMAALLSLWTLLSVLGEMEGN